MLKLRVDNVDAITATPATLTWNSAAGVVTAVFENTHRLRLRGNGSRLVIEDAQPDEPFRGSFQYIDPLDGCVVFSSNETGHRYRITVLQGQLTAQTDDSGRGAWSIDGASWEIVLDEFGTALPPVGATTDFDSVVADSKAAFRDYLEAIAPWRSEETPAAELAAYLLWASTVKPYGFIQRESILMSKHWMDRVWSWDHCFNALALAPGLPHEAWEQFLMPFDHQDVSGALPDTVGSYAAGYGFVKPPVHGWTVARMLRDLPDLDRESRRQILDRLASLTSFWLDYRRMAGHAAPHYQHGNDSGWDNSTVFLDADVVESPELAAMIVVQLKVMISLGDDLGDDRVASWAADKRLLLQTITSQFWNGKSLVARVVSDHRPVGETSLLRLMTIIAADELPSEVVDSIVAEIPEFVTEWGMATEKPTSEHYRADGYWRGPIWAPSTLLLEDGLRRAGHVDLADTLSAKFRALCERSGFAENFDALSGRGLRDLAYTWTASGYLLLAREYAERAHAAHSLGARQSRSRSRCERGSEAALRGFECGISTSGSSRATYPATSSKARPTPL